MASIPLTAEQEELRKKVKDILAQLDEYLEKPALFGNDEVKELSDDLEASAYKLHMSLKSSGHEPKHHKYMIQNRGMKPVDRGFYHHIHPAEDLLKFIEDDQANNDPEDQTLDHDFDLHVFSRRWGRNDLCKLKRISTGWHFAYVGIEGDCDKKGDPFLYKNLDHDSINYPEELPGYFEWLWDQAAESGLTHEEVQRALSQLADWISICEQNSPGGVFSSYK